MWFDPEAIVNILNLKLGQEKYHIAYHCEEDGDFVVRKPNGEIMNSIQSQSGLHYLDTACPKPSQLNDGHVFTINIVADNKASYTKTDYSQALHAKCFRSSWGAPVLPIT